MTQIGQMLINEGLEKGKTEGKTLNIISLVRKKLQKGYTLEQTADVLEEDTAGILPFFKAIENDPTATDDMIFNRVVERSGGNNFN